ncbi:diguanylate cyclase [Sphingomonas sp.]|jgi:diguanylate cyclase (GGDEF)-like protein|uniref:sensor domain-containing diguanylate cyclase n=1 Tax=Sphingomonas sp. TaxID=28214 RepID=UPI002E2F48A5|nr:diguanylate cyclase [Sphingomonas sp.]HEX4695010.1 diguanylate cyclase [Sphingomonas sp.]
MRRAGHPLLLLAFLLAAAIGLFAPPARAQSAAVTGVSLPVCVTRVAANDKPEAMFAAPARFDCTVSQTSLHQGNFWVLSQPLTTIPDRAQRERVRIASLWQDRVTLYALYPDGRIRGESYDGHAATRHLQLGGMIQWRLDPRLGAPVRLLWRVDGSANLRGILNAPTFTTAAEASRANITMAAIYSGFAGLCLALLIYNLAMWGALRHRFQLAYCAMVSSLLLYAFTSSGGLAWAFPGILNNDRLRLNYLLLAAAAATALMFARAFFPPIAEGRISRAANWLTALGLCGMTAFALLAPWQIVLLDGFYNASFAIFLVAVVPIVARARAERSAHLWLFAIAWAAPLVFAALRLLANISVVRWNFWLDNSTILAMAFEAVVSTLAIAYRIRLLSVERDEAIKREVIAARLADTDPLTGLLNRRAFLRQAFGRPGEQVLILTDLDHFKQVNETLGHDGGDEVLRLFARVLRQSAPNSALIARMGGEEFALLCHANQAIAPDAVLERLRAARMPFDLTVTTSIGACSGPLANESDWKAMYRRADQALFDAKQAGRDRARYAALAA